LIRLRSAVGYLVRFEGSKMFGLALHREGVYQTEADRITSLPFEVRSSPA
jgi:hypothetical protein